PWRRPGARPAALTISTVMEVGCLVQLPALRPVELIALDRQRTEALAHLAPNPLIAGIVDAAVDAGGAGPLPPHMPLGPRPLSAGIVDAAVDAGEAGLLAQILPVGRRLREHVAKQPRDCTGNNRGV